MSVHCGVCAVGLSHAMENYGSFSTTEFGGWEYRDDKQTISATCDDCAAVLSKAVAEAAAKIVAKHEQRVGDLAALVELGKLREEKAKRRRAELEQEWSRRAAQLEADELSGRRQGRE